MNVFWFFMFPNVTENICFETARARGCLSVACWHSCAVHCIKLKPFHYWQANLATEQDQLSRYYYIRFQHILTADIREVVKTLDMTAVHQNSLIAHQHIAHQHIPLIRSHIPCLICIMCSKKQRNWCFLL